MAVGVVRWFRRGCVGEGRRRLLHRRDTVLDVGEDPLHGILACLGRQHAALRPGQLEVVDGILDGGRDVLTRCRLRRAQVTRGDPEPAARILHGDEVLALGSLVQRLERVCEATLDGRDLG